MHLARCVLLTTVIISGAREEVQESCKNDYTALLSISSSGRPSVSPAANSGLTYSSYPLQDTVAKKPRVPGIVFVKMIKVGGEAFSALLSQFAYKHGWRALQHKDCSEQTNLLGQAICACNEHYIGPDDLPDTHGPDGTSENRYEVLYTHMHYNPRILQQFMVPGAIRLVLVRRPLDVLRSAHSMAARQRIMEPKLRDNFCQDLALDGDAWRSKCQFVQTGQDSILDYLDEDANNELKQLVAKLQRLKGNPPTILRQSLSEPHQNRLLGHDVAERSRLHNKAMSIIDGMAQRLESEFVVGVQEDYDASMLLFEKKIGWERDDTLYYVRDPNSHAANMSLPEVRKALASWHKHTPEGQKIIDKFHRGIFFYYDALYEKAVEVHKKQLRKALGDKPEVEKAIATYRIQNDKFSNCVEKLKCFLQYPCSAVNSCKTWGLRGHAKARLKCAKEVLHP